MLAIPLEEGETLDLKRQWSKTAIDALAAFANTRGGTVLVGVQDDGTVVGFAASAGDLERIINEVVTTTGLRPEVKWLTGQGSQQVLSLTVSPSPVLVACRGRYLVRVGNTNRDMTPEEVARRSLESSGQSWDAIPARRDEELNPEAIRRFIRLARSRLPWASESDSPREVADKLHLRREGRPTRAALLAFGYRPQDVAVGAVVRIARFSKGRILDDRTVGGTLLDQLEGVLERLRTYLQVGYTVGDRAALEGRPELGLLERAQRQETWEYPFEALREAVLNALMHRDYAQPSDTQIRVEDDRLEIWSPGGLLPDVSLEDLRRERHQSRRRNPLVAEVFYYAGLVERWGTGTTRMIRACAAQGLPEPEFALAEGGFRVVFYKDLLTAEHLAARGLNERQVKAMLFLKEKGRLRRADYEALTGVSRSGAGRELSQLEGLGLIVKVGTTGRGAYYVLRTTQTSQELPKNDPQNGKTTQ